MRRSRRMLVWYLLGAGLLLVATTVAAAALMPEILYRYSHTV